MKTFWQKINSIDELNQAIEKSFILPIVLFKHSTRCSISATALNRFENKWESSFETILTPYYIDLISHRDVSNEIAAGYGIQHESPQALLIYKNKCVYHASHFEIDVEEIMKYV